MLKSFALLFSVMLISDFQFAKKAQFLKVIPLSL